MSGSPGDGVDDAPRQLNQQTFTPQVIRPSLVQFFARLAVLPQDGRVICKRVEQDTQPLVVEARRGLMVKFQLIFLETATQQQRINHETHNLLDLCRSAYRCRHWM